MAEKVEWVYVYHEPKRHPDLYEFGQTKRTVEKRNKEKRSVDPWSQFKKYAVADCVSAERDIMKATRVYRYCGSKEIIQISWDKFENILEPIIKKWSHKEYNKRSKIENLKKEYIKNEYQPELKQIEDECQRESDGWSKWISDVRKTNKVDESKEEGQAFGKFFIILGIVGFISFLFININEKFFGIVVSICMLFGGICFLNYFIFGWSSRRIGKQIDETYEPEFLRISNNKEKLLEKLNKEKEEAFSIIETGEKL
jgi:hypothetical protein